MNRFVTFVMFLYFIDIFYIQIQASKIPSASLKNLALLDESNINVHSGLINTQNTNEDLRSEKTYQWLADLFGYVPEEPEIQIPNIPKPPQWDSGSYGYDQSSIYDFDQYRVSKLPQADNPKIIEISKESKKPHSRKRRCFFSSDSDDYVKRPSYGTSHITDFDPYRNAQLNRYWNNFRTGNSPVASVPQRAYQ